MEGVGGREISLFRTRGILVCLLSYIACRLKPRRRKRREKGIQNLKGEEEGKRRSGRRSGRGRSRVS